MSKPIGKKSQNDLLLDHFKTVGSISGLEAAGIHRVRDLPRRVCDLKERGFRFRHETRRDSTGQRYVRYYFMGRSSR